MVLDRYLIDVMCLARVSYVSQTLSRHHHNNCFSILRWTATDAPPPPSMHTASGMRTSWILLHLNIPNFEIVYSCRRISPQLLYNTFIPTTQHVVCRELHQIRVSMSIYQGLLQHFTMVRFITGLWFPPGHLFFQLLGFSWWWWGRVLVLGNFNMWYSLVLVPMSEHEISEANNGRIAKHCIVRGVGISFFLLMFFLLLLKMPWEKKINARFLQSELRFLYWWSDFRKKSKTLRDYSRLRILCCLTDLLTHSCIHKLHSWFETFFFWTDLVT